VSRDERRTRRETEVLEKTKRKKTKRKKTKRKKTKTRKQEDRKQKHTWTLYRGRSRTRGGCQVVLAIIVKKM